MWALSCKGVAERASEERTSDDLDRFIVGSTVVCSTAVCVCVCVWVGGWVCVWVGGCRCVYFVGTSLLKKLQNYTVVKIQQLKISNMQLLLLKESSTTAPRHYTLHSRR